MKEFVQNELMDLKLEQGILKEFVMNMLMDQKLEHEELRKFVMSSLMGQKLQQENIRELMAKSLMDRKLNQGDGVTGQCVNQSGTVENGSEHAACQLRVQEKVVILTQEQMHM